MSAMVAWNAELDSSGCGKSVSGYMTCVCVCVARFAIKRLCDYDCDCDCDRRLRWIEKIV